MFLKLSDSKSMKWWCGILVGLLVAVQPSYIHPDEHFQSLEVLATTYSHTRGTTPWEFDASNAARSFVPLYVNYGLIFRLFGGLNPMLLLRLSRLQNFLIYFCAYRFAFVHLEHSTQAEFLISTSYVTWCFQSHSFSNSLETVLLLVVLSLYNDLIRFRYRHHYVKSAILGVIIVLGMFNRITFPVFIFLPSIGVFWSFYRKSWRSLSVFAVALLVSAAVFIYIDTLLYGTSSYVLAPWNNLRYNLDESNLAQHGLHSWYTHMLINFPQLVGPCIIFMKPPSMRLKSLCRNMPLLSIFSGITLLSLFKHQEFRFLIPLAPLSFMCLHLRKSWNKFGYSVFVLFNLVMGTIMGCLHQSGVIRMLDSMHREQLDVHVWWKTYSPPTWMYSNEELVSSTTNFVNEVERVENVPFSIVHNHVVDLKGCDVELLNDTLNQFLSQNAHVTLIAPNSVSSSFHLLDATLHFSPIRQSMFHLDLDHIDVADPASWRIGIAQYNVTRNDNAPYYTSIVNN